MSLLKVSSPYSDLFTNIFFVEKQVYLYAPIAYNSIKTYDGIKKYHVYSLKKVSEKKDEVYGYGKNCH